MYKYRSVGSVRLVISARLVRSARQVRSGRSVGSVRSAEVLIKRRRVHILICESRYNKDTVGFWLVCIQSLAPRPIYHTRLTFQIDKNKSINYKHNESPLQVVSVGGTGLWALHRRPQDYEVPREAPRVWSPIVSIGLSLRLS